MSQNSFSASKSAMHGIKWGVVAMIFGQILFLGRSVAMARLLTQADFGLMGMSATVLAAFNTFTNFGLSNTVVSGHYDSEEQLRSQINTIWTADLIRRAITTVFLLLACYPTAAFYNDKRLAPILAVTCLTVLIQAFENEGLVLLQREVKFRENTIYSMINSIISTVVTVAIAFWLRNVWALVWGQIFSTVLGVGVSYLYHPFRPRFELHRDALSRSVKFGKWFVIISIMVYVTTTVDNIFVGKSLGATALGVYLIAFNISSMPQSIIGQVLSKVLFPVFAAIKRENQVGLGPAIRRVMSVSTAMLTLILVPMMVLAPEIIGTFYGPRWMGAVAPLRILLLPGLFRGLLKNVSPIMLGLDRPDLEARSKIAEAILFVIALFILVPHCGAKACTTVEVAKGIAGASWASTLAYFLAVLIRYRLAMQLVPDGFESLPSLLGTMALAATGGVASGFIVLTHLEHTPPFVRLIVGSIVVTSITGCLLLMVREDLRAEIGRFMPRLAT